MATNYTIKIGKTGLLTFIRSPGIRKLIAISPFWFLKVRLWWSGYIVWKFGELWSSKSENDTNVNLLNFSRIDDVRSPR